VCLPDSAAVDTLDTESRNEDGEVPIDAVTR
jgi:two-component system chemotaxis sensor kinase CheA